MLTVFVFPSTASNKRLERTRNKRASLLSNLGEAAQARSYALAVRIILSADKMKKGVLLTLIILLLGITSYAQDKIEISLKNSSRQESQTRDQLQRLVKTYDLAMWIFTKSILIDEKAIPHSHPTLTLNTRYLKDDDLLLSTFVHEQLHWFLVQRDKETKEAMKDLRVLFPKVPAGLPDGAGD